jgi:hypothetical protein
MCEEPILFIPDSYKETGNVSRTVHRNNFGRATTYTVPRVNEKHGTNDLKPRRIALSLPKGALQPSPLGA